MDKKQVLHAAILGGALVVSLSASAVTICSGAAGNGSTVTSGTFVKAAFTPKCSANTLVDGMDGTDYGVKGLSSKGKSIYGGSTQGGGVSLCTTFTGAASAPTATTAGC